MNNPKKPKKLTLLWKRRHRFLILPVKRKKKKHTTTKVDKPKKPILALLFKKPSKNDLDQINKIKTARKNETHQVTVDMQKQIEPRAASSIFNNIPITQPIMRSIVAAITFIEKEGGTQQEELYTYNQMQSSEVERCKILILSSRKMGGQYIIDVDSFAIFTNILVVAEGVKKALLSCEPIVPSSMYHHFMTMQHGSEVEMILSNPKWPNDLTGITFIALLHHFAKIVREANSEQNRNKLTTVFGGILIRHKENIMEQEDALTQVKAVIINKILLHITSDLISERKR